MLGASMGKEVVENVKKDAVEFLSLKGNLKEKFAEKFERCSGDYGWRSLGDHGLVIKQVAV